MGRSLMYTRNRRGPSTIPVGTPDVTVAVPRTEKMSSHQGQHVDSYLQGNFGSRTVSCI